MAGYLSTTANTRSQTLTRNRQVVSPLQALESVSSPRPGLRRWVFSTLYPILGRPVFAEQHHDGSTVLAANLSWKALRGDPAGPEAKGILVDADVVGAACRDALALAREVVRHLGVDSPMSVTTAIATAEPLPLTPVVTEHTGARRIVDQARRPRRIQPVTALVTPADEDDVLRANAQEIFTDLMHQFGITVDL